MIKGWIKLYRKLLNHQILTDSTALTVFIWCLLKANQQGKFTTGRFSGSKELKLKPSTFRDALKRLEKKHQIIKLFSPTGRYSVILILNWTKYQSITDRSVGADKNVVLKQEDDRPVVLTTQAQANTHRRHFFSGNREEQPTHYKNINKNINKNIVYKNKNLEKTFLIGNREFTLQELNRKYELDKAEGRWAKDFESWLDLFKRALVG